MPFDWPATRLRPAVRLPAGLLLLVALLTACAPEAADVGDADQPFDEARFRADIRVLASDEFGGRAPGSPGEALTVARVEAGFADAGLEPAFGDSFLQPVPLVSITTRADTTLRITGGDGPVELAYGKDMMAGTRSVLARTGLIDSDVVFAGYGIVAPEYGWDDYAGMDVGGKTVIVLVNDPGYATGDPELFKGRTMTYYGRWTYKYEEAARQGASGLLIVHETGAAGYGWPVVKNSWSGPQFDLDRGDAGAGRVPVEGWLTGAAARRVFAAAGLDLQRAAEAARQPGFRAIELGLRASVELENTIDHLQSANVVGLVRGVERPDESVLFMAHWDHLGTDPDRDGDQIFNGAVDNATGTAALIELARQFGAMDLPRTVVFAAVTAEESGLLGSAWLADRPPVPLETMVAGLNIDGMNVLGRTRDVIVIGAGQSELEEYLLEAARAQDRVVVAEPFPEKGFFFRSDHFNLAIRGVPVLYAESGVDDRARGADWGRGKSRQFVRERYHKPTDEYEQEWDLSGALEDMALYLAIGRALASGDGFPEWYEASEFRAARAASAGARSR